MKINFKRFEIMAVGSALVLTLSACGSSVTPRGSTGLASGSGPSPSGSGSQSGSQVTECVQFDADSIRLQGRMTTYYFSGTFQDDKVRLRIQNLPAEFQTNSSAEISFYRWQVDPISGVINQDQTPVSFRIENLMGQQLSTPNQPISAQFTGLAANQIAALNSHNNLVGSTFLEFLNMTSFVLDVGSTYQVLQIVLNERTNLNEVVRIGHTDVLIPAFIANPNTYRLSRPAILAGLHPFGGDLNSNLTDQEWLSRFQSACF